MKQKKTSSKPLTFNNVKGKGISYFLLLFLLLLTIAVTASCGGGGGGGDGGGTTPSGPTTGTWDVSRWDDGSTWGP